MQRIDRDDPDGPAPQLRAQMLLGRREEAVDIEIKPFQQRRTARGIIAE
jgi:hypothetical protein